MALTKSDVSADISTNCATINTTVEFSYNAAIELPFAATFHPACVASQHTTVNPADTYPIKSTIFFAHQTSICRTYYTTVLVSNYSSEFTTFYLALSAAISPANTETNNESHI